MVDNDQIMRLLEEVQREVKAQAQRLAFRWRIVAGIPIVSFIIVAPAIFSYVHHLLIRMF